MTMLLAFVAFVIVAWGDAHHNDVVTNFGGLLGNACIAFVTLCFHKRLEAVKKSFERHLE